MENRFIVEFKGDHIHAREFGQDSYESSLRNWRELMAACAKHRCWNILGESHTTPLSVADAYRHIEIYKEAGVTERHRIAWVAHSPEAAAMLRFAETVLKNRGLGTGHVFADVEQARNWLLNGGD